MSFSNNKNITRIDSIASHFFAIVISFHFLLNSAFDFDEISTEIVIAKG